MTFIYKRKENKAFIDIVMIPSTIDASTYVDAAAVECPATPVLLLPLVSEWMV